MLLEGYHSKKESASGFSFGANVALSEPPGWIPLWCRDSGARLLQKAAAWMRFIIRLSSGYQGKLLAKRSSQTSLFPMTFQDCLQLASRREDSGTHLG